VEAMQADDVQLLVDDLVREVLAGARPVAILGLTPVAIQLLQALRTHGLEEVVRGVYDPAPSIERVGDRVSVQTLEELRNDLFEVVVVASDEQKEQLLLAALPYLQGSPRVLVAGYAHYAFGDQLFERLTSEMHVPSLANGYPNSLVHIYQCLSNAARLNLDGVVVEFGMFKGGTTMFIARVVRALGMEWPVIGFDTFEGFPPRRSPLDMYDHPDCEFHDKAAVERYLDGWNVEIVEGDIVETCRRLESEDVVVAFVDTDNYTPAVAAVDVLRRRVVPGGAIVFDHFTGTDRFRYTLGERIAAAELLQDPRFFNLHGTGVFFRQSQ
jgi:O-methyltransferase